MDLEKNDCGAIFLLHEMMTQRTFSANHATLYESICAAFIRNCSTLTTDEISYQTRNMTEECLNDLKNLFAREHWYFIISKILSERKGF